MFIASVRLSVRLSETKIWSFENKSGPEKLSSAPRSTSSILEPTGCASRQRFQERSTVPFQIIAQLLLPSYLSCSKNQRRWQQSDASNDNVLSKTIQNLTFTSHPWTQLSNSARRSRKIYHTTWPVSWHNDNYRCIWGKFEEIMF